MSTLRVVRRLTVLPHADGRVYEGIWYSAKTERPPVFLCVSNGHLAKGSTDAIRDELGTRLASAGHACFALHGDMGMRAEQAPSAFSGDGRISASEDAEAFLLGCVEAFQLAFDAKKYRFVGFGDGALGAAQALARTLPERVVWIEAPPHRLEEMSRIHDDVRAHATWIFAAQRSSVDELRYIEGIAPPRSTVFVPDAEPSYQSGLRAMADALVRCLEVDGGGSFLE
jgi:hypothetical protein